MARKLTWKPSIEEKLRKASVALFCKYLAIRKRWGIRVKTNNSTQCHLTSCSCRQAEYMKHIEFLYYFNCILTIESTRSRSLHLAIGGGAIGSGVFYQELSINSNFRLPDHCRVFQA